MRKILLGLLAFTVLVTGLTIAPFSNNLPQANAVTCGSGAACIDLPYTSVAAPGGNTGGSGGIGGGSGPGTGTGGGGGGGTVRPPTGTTYTTTACTAGNGICYNENGGGYQWGGVKWFELGMPNSGSFSWGCVVTDQPIVSVTFRYVNNTIEGYSCKRASTRVNSNTILQTRTCYTSYDAALYQSTNKSAIRSGGSLAGGASSPNPRNNQPNSVHSANITLANFNLCGGIDINPTFGLNRPDQGGNSYYRLQAQIYGKQCSLLGFQAFVQDTSRNRIECGAVGPAGSASSYAVNACNYNYVKVGANHGALPNNVNFAVSACSNYQCSAAATKIGGTDQPVQVMRNGDNVPVQFANLNVNHDAGVRNITNVQRNTTVVGGSSPFNGTDANAGNQYFQLQNEKGSRLKFGQWESGNNVNRNLVFYWASDQGKNFKLSSNYKFDAEFYVYAAGSTTGGGGYVWAKDTINCANSLSNAATVTRSVNR
jgi:hypothetical protein